MSTTKELRESRGKIADEMKKMAFAVASDNRTYTAEEDEKFEKMEAEDKKLRTNIERLERAEKLDAEMHQVQSTGIGREDKVVTAQITNPEDNRIKVYRSYLLDGDKTMSGVDLSVLRALGSYANGSATPTAGGYFAPAEPTSNFIKMLRDLGGVRAAPVRYWPTNNGNDIPVPTLNDTGNNGTQVNENPNSDIGDADAISGQEVLKSYSYTSGGQPISRQLLQDSIIPIESVIYEYLAERIFAVVNDKYTNGTGSGQPEGILTGASDSSVALPTDLSDDAEATRNAILDLVHSIPPQYRARAKARGSLGLMFHDSSQLSLKKLVDDTGRPLWCVSAAAGAPDTFDGLPIYINNNMPETTEYGENRMIAADFQEFVIRDVNQVEVIRSDELLARKLQILFIAWFRTDSRVMNSNCIKYA